MAKAKYPFNPTVFTAGLPLPVIGPWVARMGYAADLFMNPCHPTLTAWYYGEFSAGARLIASLYKPFPLAETFHALKGFGRRHQLIKKDRRIAGGHSGRGWGFINALEEYAPAKQFFNQPGWNYVTIVGELAIKFEWYVFLADVTADGLINWITQAYYYTGCADPNRGWAEGTCGPGIWFPFDPQVSLDWKNSNDIVAEGPTVVTPPGDIRVSFKIEWGQFETLPPATYVTPVILIDDEPANYKPTVGWDATTKTGYSTSVLTVHKPTSGPHVISLHVAWDGGWLYITSAFCQISVYPDMKSNLNPDP